MKKILIIFLLFIVTIIGTYIYNYEPTVEWKTYSNICLKEYISKDRIVIVNLSSVSCGACQANEKFIYSSDRFKEFVLENDIILMYADYLIKENVTDFNQKIFPALFIFSPNNKVIKLEGELNIDQTMINLRKATE